MSNKTTVNNPVQKKILTHLCGVETARFSDMKPRGVSSNTYSYHIKQLITNHWIVKVESGSYTLGPKGLAFAERDMEDVDIRMQPGIKLALLVQDGYGNIVVAKRARQPYIGNWELPSQEMSIADTSVQEAAIWAAKKLLHHIPATIRHVGDCYVHITKGKLALTSTLVHVMRFEVDEIVLPDGMQWTEPLKLDNTVPGTEQIIARAFFNDQFFFEEYTHQLTTQQSFLHA